MQILLTGGTGFIGEALVPALRSQGADLIILSRQARESQQGIRYIRELNEVADDTKIDAIINLAGASLAGKRWTPRYKREIVDSRLQTTRELVALIERLDSAPATLLSGSAIGYYGHHDDEILDEQADIVEGFAQTLCSDWEQSAAKAAASGARVCYLRLGVVLDDDGGALQQMRLSFKLGVGSWAGDGSQWFSWIHRADVVRAITYLLERNDLEGPFNLTAPEPVTAREFADELGEHHHTLLSMGVPAPAMRLLIGEMAQELLLNGQRVVPARLIEAGFAFQHDSVASALDAVYS